jgi:hypothetical protein
MRFATTINVAPAAPTPTVLKTSAGPKDASKYRPFESSSVALEPKYEEARDIRMAVVEARLEEILRRRLAGKGLIMEIKPAPKPDPRIAGPRPRGSIVIKRSGLLGKKLAEFHATGAWTVAPEFEPEMAPVRAEIDARVRAEVMRRNASRVRFGRSAPTFADDDSPRTGFRDMAAALFEMEAEIADAEADGIAAKAEGLRKQKEMLESRLMAMPEFSDPEWKRDLIPG